MTLSIVQPASILPNMWLPQDHNLQAWTDNPSEVGANSFTIAAGIMNLHKIPLRQSILATNIIMGIASAGSVLANSFAGIYNNVGTLIATTADQSAIWTGSSLATMALVGGPYTIIAPFVWCAVLVGSATGAPSFRSNSTLTAAIANMGLASGSYRAGTYSSGLTSLPTSITTTNIVQSSSLPWFAIS